MPTALPLYTRITNCRYISLCHQNFVVFEIIITYRDTNIHRYFVSGYYRIDIRVVRKKKGYDKMMTFHECVKDILKGKNTRNHADE